MSEIIAELKTRFQNWFLIQRNKFLQGQLNKIPSDNIQDYFFDNLTNEFIYKDENTNVQIGLSNVLKVIQNRIETMNINITSLDSYLQSIDAHQIDIDVNIDNINSLDIDISEQVNKSISFSDNIGASSSILIAIINTEYMYNSVACYFKANDSNGNRMKLELRDGSNYTIFQFQIKHDRVIFIDEFYFPNSKYIKIYLTNQSTTASNDFTLKFYYSQTPKTNVFSNKFALQNLTTETLEIIDTNLLNRISYTFYVSGSAQDYTIKIYTKLRAVSASLWGKVLEQNITGSGGTVITGTLSFTEIIDIKVEIVENNDNVAYCDINLFFSKNLKPELDKHIIDFDTHNHNLNDLAEKLHASLAGVSTSQHHVKAIPRINLTQIATRNHNDLLNINAGSSYEHLTQTEKNIIDSLLHLEAHNLASHSIRNHSDLQNISTSQHHTKYTIDDIQLVAFRLANGTTITTWTSTPIGAMPDIDTNAEINYTGHTPANMVAMVNPKLVISYSGTGVENWTLNIKANSAMSGQNQGSNLYNGNIVISALYSAKFYTQVIQLTGTINPSSIIGVRIRKTSSDNDTLYMSLIAWIERS